MVFSTLRSAALFLFALVLAWVAPTAAQGFPPDGELLALIQERVEGGGATGIVLGVREADGTHRIVAFGDPGPGALPLGPESVFEIGSITKVFTGILLAEMAGRGEVALEDPIGIHLPPEVRVPSRNEQQIRLVDLSMHRSGLPRLPANFSPSDATNPYADYTVNQLYEFLSEHELTRDIGAEFEYSNLGTGLLGHILAGVNGTDWETLVKDRILEPLGMEMSGIQLTPEMKAHLALGHNGRDEVVPNWDLPTLAGAGALRSNALDMLAFLDANLGEPGSSLEQAMRASHEARMTAGQGAMIGLNWITRTGGERTIVWHNGGTGGYRTFIGLDPDRELGVVVLTNSNEGSDDIGFHLLDPSLPLAEPAAPPVERTEIEVDPDILQEYVGVYQLAPGVEITVTLGESGLAAQVTGQPSAPIFPESESEFFYKIVDAQITFVRDEGGRVTLLVLRQSGREITAERVR
jgi:CubicO group peptidase (beta-lactamase class C family)